MKPTPAGWPRISSAVLYEYPRQAIDFLIAAFGFELQLKVEEQGQIVHSQLTLPGGLVMVSGLRSAQGVDDEWRRSPQQLGGGNTQSLFIYVDDVDAHCAVARAAGARICQEPHTTDYGEGHWTDRGYGAVDLEGHRWYFAQRMP